MSDNVAAHLMRIHINREAYQSPNPTTGEALYILGSIPKHEKLYREAGGDKEDELVSRDDARPSDGGRALLWPGGVRDLCQSG